MLALLSVLLIFSLVALFIVIQLLFRAKNNHEKEKAKFQYDRNELTKVKELLNEKNNDFEASVIYAKRLVDAIFKIGKYVAFDRLKYSLLYEPKDIISGDFIWHQSKYDRHYFVVADCTGHGVPGAFMSIVSYNLFNQAVNEFGFTKPSEILNHVNEKHIEIFNAENEDIIRDGMDVAICVIDTDSELIEFAGAMRPLYILRENGDLERIKGDRMSIGVDGYNSEINFTDQIIDFLPGDSVYLTTDGFVDQFGGPKGKKYKSSRFKELIKGESGKPIGEQIQTLKKELWKWKGNYDQIDDITILGISYDD